MDLHYQREVTVGTLVLVGIGVFVAGTMWLQGRSFHPVARTAQAEFREIGTLQRDNEVAVSGFTVGKVTAVELKGPGRVLVTFTLPTELTLRSDATAEVSSGLFAGATRLLLHAGSDSAPLLQEGQIIRGNAGSDLFARGIQLADRADSVLIGVQAMANRKTANEITQAIQALHQLLTTMNQQLPATTDEARETMVALRKLARRLDSTLAALPMARADTLAGNLSTMSLQLTATGARLDTLLQKINGGQGTLGKFATDTGLYLDSRQALQALRVLLEELNKNPGKLTVQVKMF